MSYSLHWSKEDYFPYLNDTFKSAVLALEYMVDDLHVNKEDTVDKFLNHDHVDNLIVGIVKLMASENLRVSGNSAYVFGTIAETSDGIESVLNLLNKKSHYEANNVLEYLVKLLKSSDYECMMNAAGTIGTISENNLGRSWLISQPLLDKVIELSTDLLDNKNIWVSSNAALVLARITIEEDGCEKILKHDISSKILQKMVESLGCDNAGRGMNCAFAIGRLCDTENGRLAFMEMNSFNYLIESLFEMIETNSDNGCTKNACYAVSCLASNEKAHKFIVNNKSFNNLLNTLCKLLTTVKDAETQWFAAMLLRIFSSFPAGCVKMKNAELVWQTLNELLKKKDLYVDVREEINMILDTLKPIEKPELTAVTVSGPSSVRCEWKLLKTKSKLTINYHLFKNQECVYKGQELNFEVKNLEPYTEYSFSLQALIVENNEKSELSEEILVRTEESVPSEPLNLKISGATTNMIRVTWGPPQKPNGILKSYFVYKDENLIEQTNDLSSTITGLQPDNAYDIYICASTCKGKGDKAYLRASTCGLGDVIPEKPTFGMIGRREILVRWQPPPVVSGKLTRYELLINSKCVYSGIMQEYQVIMLKPDTEYKFEVIAITTEGKFKSRVAKVRTLKDEYDPDRAPLYPGAIQPISNPSVSKEKTEFSLERKRSFNTDRIMLTRSKTKPKIIKDVLPTMVCEEIDINNVKKLNSNVNSNLRYSDGFLNESSFFVSQNSNYDESILQMDRPSLKLHRGKSEIRKNTKQNNDISLKATSKNHLTRSKTTIKSPNLKNCQTNSSPVNNQNYVQPTIFAFNLKEMSPKFPIIPLVVAQSLPQSSCSAESNIEYNNTTNNQVPSIFQVKDNYIINRKKSNESRFSSKSNDKKIDGEFQLQYQYLINKLNKT
ncbi:unnamed protein product [Brachionus calyciflorus]|uniref:Fibronectin type-III domain-containing protein n=1 Tax=Brachionus calyciflorus TaxID=104777 RepID=A0A813MLK5_9BILA|nr:unnamed protein product [Brachionus calyciflorus]